MVSRRTAPRTPARRLPRGANTSPPREVVNGQGAGRVDDNNCGHPFGPRPADLVGRPPCEVDQSGNLEDSLECRGSSDESADAGAQLVPTLLAGHVSLLLTAGASR